MAKDHWNALNRTTKQPLSNFEPWKSWKYKPFWELGMTLVAHKNLHWRMDQVEFVDHITSNYLRAVFRKF